jgi:23S rRNA (pseudouridine1915-N3)-methyltransferase
MKVKIVCVGRLKELYWTDACDEYIKRLSAFCDLEIAEISESKFPGLEQALEAEADNLLKNTSGFKIALCIEGQLLSSEELSGKLQEIALDSENKGSITFFIGSSHGLAGRLKAKCDLLLSMSKMTFPHQMARVVLLEQIYRAFQIINNGKYHK